MNIIGDIYEDYYYLTRDGKVYNSKTKKYLKMGNSNVYKLKTKVGAYKRISVKKLYKLVYDEPFCIDTIESLNNEKWKPIERTDKIYWISDKGRCKSYAGYEAKILNPYYSPNGYQRVDIMQDGSRCNKLISRLVASAFLLPPKEIDMQLHHKNCIKTDNRKENLIWVTPTEHKKLHDKVNKQETTNNEEL